MDQINNASNCNYMGGDAGKVGGRRGFNAMHFVPKSRYLCNLANRRATLKWYLLEQIGFSNLEKVRLWVFRSQLEIEWEGYEKHLKNKLEYVSLMSINLLFSSTLSIYQEKLDSSIIKQSIKLLQHVTELCERSKKRNTRKRVEKQQQLSLIQTKTNHSVRYSIPS